MIHSGNFRELCLIVHEFKCRSFDHLSLPFDLLLFESLLEESSVLIAHVLDQTVICLLPSLIGLQVFHQLLSI